MSFESSPLGENTESLSEELAEKLSSVRGEMRDFLLQATAQSMEEGTGESDPGFYASPGVIEALDDNTPVKISDPLAKLFDEIAERRQLTEVERNLLRSKVFAS